jgi:hypothetical protein
MTKKTYSKPEIRFISKEDAKGKWPHLANNPIKKDGIVFEKQSAKMDTLDLEEKERMYWNTSAFAYFTSYENRIARGTLEMLYFKHTVDFQGLDQLTLILEDMMDAANENSMKKKYPQATLQRRTVTPKSELCAEKFFQNFESIRGEPKKPCFFNEKKIAFAVITVNYRQHASMQGTLKIGRQEVCFRSALELQRLLHQALMATVGETKIEI